MAARKTKTKTIPATKEYPEKITFKEGGLHKATKTKSGEKISAAKHAAAASGKLGEKAEKQERFYRNVLSKGHKSKK